MAEDEAFGGAADAAQHGAPLLMPMPAILLVLAAIGLWAFWQFLIVPGRRLERRRYIYREIRVYADKAVAGGVQHAAVHVLNLRNAIQKQVGDLIAGGDMCAIVTGVNNILGKPPKQEGLALVGGSKPQFTRLVTIQESGAPVAGEPETKMAVPPSANEQLFKLAQDFAKYWANERDRMEELERAQTKLGV